MGYWIRASTNYHPGALLAVFVVAVSCGGAQEIRSLVDTVIREPTASPAPTLEPTSEPEPTATATTVLPAPPTLTPVPPTAEPASIVYYADADGDGYGDPASLLQAVVAPPGYVADDTDCDGSDDSVNPGAAEVFDGVDNDCDGVTDEGVIPAATATVTPTLTPTPTAEVEITVYYEDADADADGYGNDANSLEAVVAPPGYVAVGGDCDDFDSETYPGAVEVADGIDNDCNGATDDGIVMVFYEDLDADTYGGPNSVVATVVAGSLVIPPGYTAVMGGDCDDTDDSVYPGAVELLDTIDNDCDGEIDEGTAPVATPTPPQLEVSLYFQDADGDGFGNAANSLDAVGAPPGYVTNGDDCDDSDFTVNPGAVEVLDGIDNDCTWGIDEGLRPMLLGPLDSAPQ